MHIALEDLKLERIDVIHAGEQTFPLAPRLRAVSFERIITDIRLYTAEELPATSALIVCPRGSTTARAGSAAVIWRASEGQMESATTIRDAVRRIKDLGDDLPEAMENEIIGLGLVAVPHLRELLDESLLAEQYPQDAAFLAAELLGRLKAVDAVPALFRLLMGSDVSDMRYEELLGACAGFGAQALEPALADHAAATTDEQRANVCDALADLGVRDDRVFAALSRLLDDDVEHGTLLLARYGDPEARRLLSGAFDRCPVHAGNSFRNHVFIELKEAIESLGGALTEAQREKWHQVERHRNRLYDDLDQLSTDDDDDEPPLDDQPFDVAIDEAVERFRVAQPSIDPGWVELMFRYGADYEGAQPEEFDGDVLDAVLFELFPRKVSCEPHAAPEIVKSLVAYWTFARDELRHPGAGECLRTLSGDAVDRLRRELDDISNYGMAKSFFMQGRERGFDVATEEGFAEWVAFSNAQREAPPPASARSREDKARKKKLKKQRKKAQRRNRR